jgi:hypothetical protein
MTSKSPVRAEIGALEKHFGTVTADARRFGHVVSVSGPQAIVVLEGSRDVGNPESRVQIGALVKIPTPESWVVGIIAAVSSPMPEASARNEDIGLVELSLAGEIMRDKAGKLRFCRGVSNFPSIADPVLFADRDDLTCVYIQPDVATIEVGAIFQDQSVPARLLVDDLLGKHFIVVGTTGCGKSTALTGILQKVLENHNHAHIVVLDIHSEYANAFGDKAEVIRPSNLRLPFWLLNFQELTTALISTDSYHDAEIEILTDAVIAAKKRYSDAAASRVRRVHEPNDVTVDTPTPFRLSDIIAYIDEQMGRLERTQPALPYRRLKRRIEAVSMDPRYAFMFGSLTVEDTMTDVLGRVFRVPNEGRPITVIDLAAVPGEILDVVISLISRLAFDLAVWSEGNLPLLLVCEEAHRYAPAGAGDKFVPTRQALARIAKEGRKYGVSLALITQRPSELDTTILSQCNTAIAMRLSTERDQQVMRANTHDGALDLLDYLPLLADREAIILGQGVAMPMRIRFSEVERAHTPSLRHNGFSSAWKNENMDRAGLEETISRWRSMGRHRG